MLMRPDPVTTFDYSSIHYTCMYSAKTIKETIHKKNFLIPYLSRAWEFIKEKREN